MKRKLFYAAVLFLLKLNIYSQSPSWQVNESQFQYTMTTVAFLNINGTTLSSTEDKVAAFVDEELRGSVNLTYVASTNRYLAYLVIFSNSTNETINFKIYNSTSDAILDVPKTLNFAINQHYGNVFQAYSLASPVLSNEAKIIDYNFEKTTIKKDISTKKITIESNVFVADNIKNLNSNFVLSDGAKLFESTNQIFSGNNSLDYSSIKTLNVLSEDESVFEEWSIEIINVDKDNDGVFSDTDCDDNEPLAYPGNTEILNDGIDNDCDPNTLDNGTLNLKLQTKKLFTIFPNPTRGIIEVKHLNSYSESFLCSIFDINGREIKRFKYITTDFKIDLNKFKKGVYFIKLSNKTNKQIIKIINN
jgi:hypothetical protein